MYVTWMNRANEIRSDERKDLATAIGQRVAETVAKMLA